MINTQDITVGNTTSKLIKYRSFVYKGEKYTVFIEPTTETEDSPGEIRMLAPLSDGTYTLPPADICRLLYPLCVDMILYQMHFDPALSADIPMLFCFRGTRSKSTAVRVSKI